MQVARREKEISNKTAKITEMEVQMMESASKLRNLINLNVGKLFIFSPPFLTFPPFTSILFCFRLFLLFFLRLIGGRRFTLPKATLMQHKGSYFEALLTSPYSTQVDGEYVSSSFLSASPLPPPPPIYYVKERGQKKALIFSL